MYRVIATGASNLALGLQSLVANARAAFGADVEVIAATGYGRSYGAPSTIAARTLPGILQSNLWRDLAQRPRASTRALITDVGNDVLYDVPPEQILEWVDETVARFHEVTNDVVVTGLPLESIHRLSSSSFLFFRSLFFPPCRLSQDEVFRRVDEVHAGLERLAELRGLRFVSLKPAWYGVDPIHIRGAHWRSAWRSILVGDVPEAPTGARLSAIEWAHLHQMSPERQWLLGRERLRPQTGRALRLGGRVWLY